MEKEELERNLTELQRNHMVMIRSFTSGENLSPSDRLVLLCIATFNGGPMNYSTIAHLTGLSVATATKSAKRLIEAGIIEVNKAYTWHHRFGNDRMPQRMYINRTAVRNLDKRSNYIEDMMKRWEYIKNVRSDLEAVNRELKAAIEKRKSDSTVLPSV